MPATPSPRAVSSRDLVGGSRNVPRPSHGDISCSGSGTRGVEQMLLDDHHIDDDDDEGVELTEPGVKPSNAIRTRAIRLYDKNTRGSRSFNSTKKYLEIKHARHIRSTELFIHTHVMKGMNSLLQPLIVKRSSAKNGSAGGNKATMEKRTAGNGLAWAVEPRWVNDKSGDHIVRYGNLFTISHLAQQRHKDNDTAYKTKVACITDIAKLQAGYLFLEVPWSNEHSLENKELNAIIGAWFTLWQD
uniref:Ulp1 protease family, C-terminal catalytic domain-containing protein n=1 Tax=Tanacetum cinerariifolium TaxID=118510 RepID=A0A6L2NFY1_TANCI|nr:ulp1 protease family, C-terminal catalytic domain-containing protein [Tanacetum cinerariifolium]